MQKYDHKKVEKKWQDKWEKEKPFAAKDSGDKSYLLIEFPYPSGDGLHVGHIRSWTAMDAVARKRRAEGINVLYPIGWDAFGLPAENYAIKTGIHPKISTKQNTENFKRQIKSVGISFDWSREIDTTDLAYYKWTQWIFLQIYKKGLAYKTTTLINWCPKDKVTLANEEVVDGACERCGTGVEKKEKEQWMLAITKYAQRLYDDLDTVDYITPAKLGQRNWIGPSEGSEIEFDISNSDKKIKVFTTRADTLYGATYMVLAPEHPLLNDLKQSIENWDEVLRYIEVSKKKSDIERGAEGREKTGVELKGVRAINPANKEAIPVFIADYVIGNYGTGAIMAVPAYDERDAEFAKVFNLPVIEAELVDKEKITAEVGGKLVTTFKLRDWVYGRQRYWGEPIPMIKCSTDGWVPVPEDQLPVLLPETDTFLPGKEGESPLASMDEWVKTTCPTCGGPAERETDVMPQWAGSSWYYLAYCISESIKSQVSSIKTFADKDIQEKFKFWTPVDWYNGGMEHTTLHLLYSRFWHKVLFDLGLVPSSEPYLKRTSHGLILAEGGEKMSKSKGNTVSPDTIVEQFGADSLRLYEMFIGPFDQPVAWSTNSIMGVRRFLERSWALADKVNDATPTPETDSLLHQTIDKVTKDIEALKMNTAVSSLMILSNHLHDLELVPKDTYGTFLKLLQPFAPHAASELLESLGVSDYAWPQFDPDKVTLGSVEIAVQVNGKVRGTVTLSPETPEAEAIEAAKSNEQVAKWLEGKEVKRAVYIAGKIVNFVVS
jgi:leucyl-tRNA synthetase